MFCAAFDINEEKSGAEEVKSLNPTLFFLYFVQVGPGPIHKIDGEDRRKRLQNAQPQKELLRSTGDWGVPQQAAFGKVDSQKHRLLLFFSLV